MVPPGPIGERSGAGGEASSAPEKKRVLFVCIGNSCRSQMAEAFARSYGSDVLIATSAGLSPAMIVAPQTHEVLREKNIGTAGQFPKDLDSVLHRPFDLIVNMSGFPLAIPRTRVVEWDVPDPIGEKDDFFRAVANQIESLIMRLILDFRRERSAGPV